jgi:hypothetical protein
MILHATDLQIAGLRARAIELEAMFLDSRNGYDAVAQVGLRLAYDVARLLRENGTAVPLYGDRPGNDTPDDDDVSTTPASGETQAGGPTMS